MPVDQERAFVRVAVAAQNQVDAEVLENGQCVLPHLHQLDLRVRVVRAFRVRRMMPVRDDPRLRIGREIALKPGEHRARWRSVGLERFELDEMDVGIVERIVGFGAGRNTSRFTLLWQREDVVVRARIRCGI